MEDTEEGEDLLFAARYGEEEYFIKNKKIKNINYFDNNKNNALHCACANGHLNILYILLKYNIEYTKNLSGNTPLHWAILNGNSECVDFLMKNFNLDVLDENNGGKSALSLAFEEGNDIILKLVLEHKSAEKLEEMEISENSSIIHEMRFEDEGPVVMCREMSSEAVVPFDKCPENDTTGTHIWAASLVMAQSLHIYKEYFEDCENVLELGSGCGLVGLYFSKIFKKKKIFLTDCSENTLKNLRFNVSLCDENVYVEKLDWSKEETYPEEPVDIVLGCDLIYDKDQIPSLINVLSKMMKINGYLFYCYHVHREGADEFLNIIKNNKKYNILLQNHPNINILNRNCLINKEKNDFFALFNELNSAQIEDYILVLIQRIG
eukprot:GHVL01021899.1.p1 GENE.GHVL01021899.1~~GHVL01021899.1.p1  ORF type:complete len:378 (+),score=92.62 GHVL01021899.1:83-1216(+)